MAYKFLNSLTVINSTFSSYNSGGTANDSLRISSSNLGASFGVQNTNASGFAGIEYIDNSGSVKVFTGFNNSNGQEFRFNNIASGGYIDFLIGGTTGIKLFNNRNVTIGSATDGGQKLQVVGDTKITGATSAGNYSLSVYNSSNAISFYVRGFGDALLAGTLFLGTQNGPNFISNGTLGITSSQGTGNQFIRFTHNNGNNAIRILSNSVIELNPVAGNVLIGTTTDNGAKLQVSGTSSFAGDVALNGNRLYIGSVLGNTVLRPISTTNLQLFNANAGAGLFLDANGYVQIGQSNAVNWAYFSASGTTIYGTTTLSTLAGTGTRMVVADATGILSTQAVPTGTITGSGTTNYVSKWSSSSSLTNSVLYDDGTNLGIGTTTPNRKLTISNSGDALIGLNTITNGISTIGANFSGSFIVYDDTASTYRLVVKQTTGNVGIGTESPSWKLVVSDNGGAGLEINPNTSSNAVGIYSYDRINSAYRTLNLEASKYVFGVGNVLIGTSTDAGFKLDVNGDIRTQTGYIRGANSDADLRLDGTVGSQLRYGGQKVLLNSADAYIYTANTARLYINNAGNVGIGTTSPQAKLHLSQSSGNTESIIEAIGGTPIFTMLGTSSSVPLFGFNGTGLRIGSVTGANAAGFSELMRITSAGNVGIGTSSPGSKLEISGPTGSYSSGIGFTPTGTGARVYRTYIGTNGFFYFDDASAGATRITLSASGNLGIGTNNPDYFATSGRTILSLNGASSSLLEFKVGDVFQSYIYNSGSTFEFYSSNRFDFYTAGVARLVIAPSGNVLIGTLTDNGSKLQVAGNATLGQGQNRPVTYDSNGGNFRITANPSGWATGYFFNGSSGTFRGGFGAYGDFDNTIYHWIGDDYNIPTMTLYPNQGNVGISTTSPAQKLDVNGLIRTNRTSNTDGGVVFGTVGTYLYGADSGGYLATYTSNTERMRIASNGVATINNLGGSGTRMVVADASGTLSTQAIPGGGAIKAYGSWQSNNTQLSPANNFPTPVIYDVVNFNNNISVDLDFASQYTLITMLVDGVFNIQFSFQFRNLSSSDQDVYIWFRKNGQTSSDDIPNSNTLVSVPAKHGSGTPGHTVAAWNLFVQATANDYFQIVWATSDKTNVSMEYIPPTPFGPGSPSSILTVNKVD
jgi:hypothetical protein